MCVCCESESVALHVSACIGSKKDFSCRALDNLSDRYSHKRTDTLRKHKASYTLIDIISLDLAVISMLRVTPLEF